MRCAHTAIVTAFSASFSPRPPPPRPEVTEYARPRARYHVGGGNMEGTGIIEKFIQLAGGRAKFVIVPTAQGNRDRDGIADLPRLASDRSWQRRGLKNVRMLTPPTRRGPHGRVREPLLDASGSVRGRQPVGTSSLVRARGRWRSFARSSRARGSSARQLCGRDHPGRLPGPGRHLRPDVMMTEEKTTRRLRLPPQIRYRPAHQTRARWDDLVPVSRNFPTSRLGLSEGTAIVVNGAGSR